MNNILITGSGGQLGQCLRAIHKNYPKLKFTFLSKNELDITNEEQLCKLFLKYKFKFCVNTAAYTNVDLAESQKKKAYLVNETGAKLISKYCKKHDVFLIHISTDYVFDGTKGSAYYPDDAPNPINIYGMSKLAGERAIFDVCGDFTIIRTSWLYSEYGQNFQTKILNRIKEKKKIKVVNNIFGTPTYAPKLAEYILNKITSKKEWEKIEHFSQKKTMSWYDLANKITRKIKIEPVNDTEFKQKANRPKNTSLA